MADIININQEHKHVARLMDIVYTYTEERFRESDYGINIEYDLAIKLLARIACRDDIEDASFKDKLLHDLEKMIDSFKRVKR